MEFLTLHAPAFVAPTEYDAAVVLHVAVATAEVFVPSSQTMLTL
jgi:hypothetical protein